MPAASQEQVATNSQEQRPATSQEQMATRSQEQRPPVSNIHEPPVGNGISYSQEQYVLQLLQPQQQPRPAANIPQTAGSKWLAQWIAHNGVDGLTNHSNQPLQLSISNIRPQNITSRPRFAGASLEYTNGSVQGLAG